MNLNFYQELKARGLIYQVTDEYVLKKKLNEEILKLYIGFDPTANSLHVGHLLPILMLRRFQLNGHVPIILIGGGTGMIGDPSFKDKERTLNSLETVQQWAKNIKNQLSNLIDFGSKCNRAIICDNYEWLRSISFIDFLRDIGKNFTISYMMSKESVKRRIGTGISYTEFAYQLLQAYDFLMLYERYDCLLQLGGSDQWGNITSGVELLNKEKKVKGLGVTIPLITKSDGKKFGKTERNPIWLDKKKTTSYEFYQFWINTNDSDVINFLKYFTFLSLNEISEIEREFISSPKKRLAQKILAREITTLVHGKSSYEKAYKISKTLFSREIKDLNAFEISELFYNVPVYHVKKHDDLNLVEILITSGIEKSKRQSKEDIKNGAIYVNGERIDNIKFKLGCRNKIDNQFIVIRKGKKKNFLLKF